MNGAPLLEGLKVVEFAQLIAGPLAGTLLADLGADVVHVEDPVHGDSSRRMGPAKDGVPLWWKVAGRNKRSITLDLRTRKGQELAHRLVGWADVVITNIRYDTLVRWSLDWETVHRVNRKAIMLQVTGNGATSTARNEPGFGKVGEARSGVVAITGFPDGPPVHTGFSHADSVTGLMGAFSIAAALTRRHEPDFEGEWIDIALFEPLYRLIEWQVIVHDQLGVVPARAGNQLAVAPAAVINTYQAADGRWVTVTSATSRSVQNVAKLLGESVADYATAEQQLARRERLDQLLRDYVGSRDSDDAVAAMVTAGVVASRIYDMADIFADRTYAERADVIEVPDDELGPVRMQGIVPKLRHHPGRIWRTGPGHGQDNEIVFREYLGLPADEFEALVDEGTVGRRPQ
ncbi:CoA transferase [Streptomyces sp. NPDC051985]|uniref:CaiB/BaiF CoA transferase family protein n=1 Tax=Streptomyces sp. NPDC051985 TaxID=3155807 RepID=UPI0034444624